MSDKYKITIKCKREEKRDAKKDLITVFPTFNEKIAQNKKETDIRSQKMKQSNLFARKRNSFFPSASHCSVKMAE